MNAVKLDAEARDVEHGSLLDVVLQLSLLLETFVLLSFPHFPLDAGLLPTTPHSMDLNRFFLTTEEDDVEAELQKLSLTMRINLDPTHCSYEVAHVCVFSESVFIPFLCFGSIPLPWFHSTAL